MNYTELKAWIDEAQKLKDNRDLAPLALIRIVNTLNSAVEHKIITKKQKVELHRHAMKVLNIQEGM